MHHLVLDVGILDWRELGRILNISVEDVKYRWKKFIYPTYLQTITDGSLKWSKAEDALLERGYKKDMDVRG